MSNANTKNKLSDLRDHLFAALESLNDNDKPMEVDRAKAICGVAGKIIDTAKVEVQFLKEVGGMPGDSFWGRSALGDIPAERQLTNGKSKHVAGSAVSRPNGGGAN